MSGADLCRTSDRSLPWSERSEQLSRPLSHGMVVMHITHVMLQVRVPTGVQGGDTVTISLPEEHRRAAAGKSEDDQLHVVVGGHLSHIPNIHDGYFKFQRQRGCFV
jgi:hypothetical protein